MLVAICDEGELERPAAISNWANDKIGQQHDPRDREETAESNRLNEVVAPLYWTGCVQFLSYLSVMFYIPVNSIVL